MVQGHSRIAENLSRRRVSTSLKGGKIERTYDAANTTEAVDANVGNHRDPVGWMEFLRSLNQPNAGWKLRLKLEMVLEGCLQ